MQEQKPKCADASPHCTGALLSQSKTLGVPSFICEFHDRERTSRQTAADLIGKTPSVEPQSPVDNSARGFTDKQAAIFMGASAILGGSWAIEDLPWERARMIAREQAELLYDEIQESV